MLQWNSSYFDITCAIENMMKIPQYCHTILKTLLVSYLIVILQQYPSYKACIEKNSQSCGLITGVILHSLQSFAIYKNEGQFYSVLNAGLTIFSTTCFVVIELAVHKGIYIILNFVIRRFSSVGMPKIFKKCVYCLPDIYIVATVAVFGQVKVMKEFV